MGYLCTPRLTYYIRTHTSVQTLKTTKAMATGKKTGGRKAGTPNKVSGAVRKAISSAIDGYYNSDQFITDLAALKPVERVQAMEKLAQYAVPKLQSTTLDATVEKRKTIEDRLRAASKVDGTDNDGGDDEIDDGFGDDDE